ncbi:PepSY domain-containing protein [Pseudoalteromonas shioyasakiensis]|uniref:PepSY-associated TM helix domain-containing protein n=1 Tax=Pseudoalteromonas shioyasakiensis TaxID=1190813 RepID=UPI002117B477|nr:PepSY-associated TM helix domain-containing protein [Pseudoalteromonas shioyasakiensis]MCQ8877978.1 PepSY domain-containing protein [Pseudoalteromonas shioyasakiensis]
MAKVSQRFWFQLHGWFSLPIWVLFCFICITGTISVISHELTWLTNSEARATNPNNLPEKSKQTLIASLKAQHPTADVMSVVSYEPYLVNALIFTDTDKPYATAYVNQYTGEVQAINQTTSFIEFMRTLHGWLYFPWQEGYSVGYYLVSTMALVILGALITGLIIYKNFWRAFSQPKIRFNQGRKTLLKDLHTVSGVWSIWFMAIMSLTGLWYLVQSIMWHNEIDIEEHAPLVSEAQLPSSANAQAIDLDSAIALTKNKFADFKPTYIMLPEHNRGMYNIMGAGDTIFYDNYSYSTSVNPWTGTIAASKSPETMTTLQTLSHIADPLHYGTIGGIWTKIIWFIFGVILSGMSITGFMMYSKKLVKAEKPSSATISNSAEAS